MDDDAGQNFCTPVEAARMLNFVRDRQRNRQWRSPHTVPAVMAGWVVPAAGELRGADGLRPLGMVRRELAEAVATAALEPESELIIHAWYGLRGFPADLSGPGNLVSRVSSRSPRATDRAPLTVRAVELRRDQAVSMIAAVLQRRPRNTDQEYGGLPPAWREPWCKPLFQADFERAFDLARDLLAVGSPEPTTSITNRLHAELDTLQGRIIDGLDTVPESLTRANAALSIALWEVLLPTHQSPSSAARPYSLPPSLTRSAVERAVRTTAPAQAAPLLRGNRDDHSLLAAVRSAADQKIDPAVAWPILEICLTEALTPVLRRDPQVVVRVVYAVVRYARVQEDWRAVILARWLVDEHPTTMAALNACIDASITAGAHLRFAAALKALDRAEAILPGIAWPPPHIKTIETAEWTFLLRMARTAVLRRAAENAVAVGATDLHSENAVQLALECYKDAARIPGFDGRSSDGGDADAGYVALPLLRVAELHGLAAQQLAVANGRPDRSTHQALSRARSAMGMGLELAAGERTLVNADFAVLEAKLRLRIAIVEGSEHDAAEASAALQAAGWPLERSDLPLFLALKEAATGVPQVGLTDSMRRAAAAALNATLITGADLMRVPAGYRRSQLNVFRTTS